MANSNGIDYFPFNVDFFDDDKLALIESEFGLKGSIIAIRLLCKIYKEGYYYQWGDDECLLFARKAGAGIVPNVVKEVVSGLVKRSFFDKGVFDSFNILTSRGIQSRYFEAVKRRQRVEVRREFLLVDVSKYSNVHILGENVGIEKENVNISAQSKVKESRVKESKRKETPPLTPPHGVVSSSQEAELSFENSLGDKNSDTLVTALSKFGATSEQIKELKRLSNDGDPKSVIWTLLESMEKSKGKISMNETLQTMLMYERQRLIRCKTKERVWIEETLPDVVKPDEKAAVLLSLTTREREAACIRAISEVRNSSGKIRMPGKFIISEISKIKV